MIIATVILACVLYDVFSWIRYKEQEEIYYSEIKLNLAPACKEIMQETYRQYLGPVDFAKEKDKGSVKLIATVYFPNMAPQNIHCSIYLDNFLIGYDENSVVNIHFLGTDYAPTDFYQRGSHGHELFTKTTFKKLQNYISAPISPRKKPTLPWDEQKI